MKLVIPDLVHKKIMHWVHKSSYEVSGLGMLEHDAFGVCTVTDVMLLPQTNAAAHTDIEGEMVGKAMFELRGAPGQLRFWWHSHVDMGVFWSQQDRETIKLCGQGGWCVATVFNKKNERRTAFYSQQGMTLPWAVTSLFLDEVATEVITANTEQQIAWDAEYDKNVKIKSWNSLGRDEYGRFNSSQILGDGMKTSGAPISGNSTKKLSKKERKRLKKQNETSFERCTPPKLSDDTSPLDLFDDGDKMVMRACGYTEDDIAEVSAEQVFSAEEVIELVCKGFEPSHVRWASGLVETEGYSVDDILRLACREDLTTDQRNVPDNTCGAV